MSTMTNLQILQKAMEDAKREQFIIYDNPESVNKKIILEPNTGVVNIVSLKGNKVKNCTCDAPKSCKHMIKIATKFAMDIELEGMVEPKKSSSRNTKKDTKSKVVKLKAVGEE